MAIWTGFLLAFSALLPLINPVGSALVFLTLVGTAQPETYRSLARRIAINNIIFLSAVELAGSLILNFFGLSLPTVQVAGGIVVAAMGWNVLNEDDSEAEEKRRQEACDEQCHVAIESNLKLKTFYPFTFPVTSGPGTLVATLTLSAHMSSHHVTANLLGHCGVFLAILLLSVIVYICYAYAPRVTTRISSNTAHGIMRVTAFILLCIGVQIAWNGLSVLLKAVLKG